MFPFYPLFFDIQVVHLLIRSTWYLLIFVEVGFWGLLCLGATPHVATSQHPGTPAPKSKRIANQKRKTTHQPVAFSSPQHLPVCLVKTPPGQTKTWKTLPDSTGASARHGWISCKRCVVRGDPLPCRRAALCWGHKSVALRKSKRMNIGIIPK